jgi:hypothetical protein
VKTPLILLAALLAACATDPQNTAYDAQFCTLSVRLADGREQCKVWTLGPTEAQKRDFDQRKGSR